MDINAKIDEVKLRIKNITKHFNYTEDIIDILTICYIAIVSFDSDVMDILEEVLAKKYILINNGKFNLMLNHYYPDINPFLDNYVEPSFNENEIYNDDFIIIRKFNLSCDCLVNNFFAENRPVRSIIESFLHEIKHAMNSVIKRYERGIFYCGMCTIDGHGRRDYELLEEGFNSFLIFLYLEQVNKLCKYKITDDGIRMILERFSLNGYKYSYLRLTSLLAQFFADESLFKLFYNAVLYKDFESLFSTLKVLLGENVFYILNDLLKEFYDHYDYSIYEFINGLGKNDSLRFEGATIEKMTL